MSSGDPGSRRRPASRLNRRPPALRVAVVDAQGRATPAGRLDRWLASVAPREARGAVSVALVSDARMRALNRRYRAKDYATDVLSFPAWEPAGIRAAGDAVSASGVQSREAVHFLGDIVIATGVARRQASRAGHSELTEVRILALHGLLHLIGYDHETDRGTMAQLEQRLRRKGRLREGLIERAAGRQ